VLDELKVLQDVRIASPCSASWEGMTGNEQVRFCDHCQLHVHNLSVMSASRAAALVQAAEGRLCVRYDAQPDGSMLVEPQEPGLPPTRRRFLMQLAASLFGLLGLRGFATAGSANSTAANRPRSLMGAPPPRQTPVSLQGQAVASPQPPPQRTMGKIAAPATRPQPRMGEPTITDRPPAGATTGPPRALMGDVALPPRTGRKPKPVSKPKPKRPQPTQAHKPRRGAK
jgi:hypothetical protein